MELREKIARALFAHETHGLSPPDVALDWDKDGHAWFGFADVVLEIPEIRDALEHRCRDQEILTPEQVRQVGRVYGGEPATIRVTDD